MCFPIPVTLNDCRSLNEKQNVICYIRLYIKLNLLQPTNVLTLVRSVLPSWYRIQKDHGLRDHGHSVSSVNGFMSLSSSILVSSGVSHTTLIELRKSSQTNSFINRKVCSEQVFEEEEEKKSLPVQFKKPKASLSLILTSVTATYPGRSPVNTYL